MCIFDHKYRVYRDIMLFHVLTFFVCINVFAVSSDEFRFRPTNKTENEGYVEMTINGTWGIMSSPYTKLDDNTARILCRTFGFGLTGFSTSSQSSLELLHNAAILWYSVIQCNGTESNPSQCALTIPNGGPLVTTLPKGWTMLHCFDFIIRDIRLHGGQVPNEGRLEVKVDDRWGTVCGHPNEAASLYTDDLCSLLGYAKDSRNISHPYSVDNIEPVGDFWMSNLRCSSTYNDINQCNFDKGADHYCQGEIGYVVILQCEPAQLINGTLPNVGIVEVGLLGKRQMVCGASTFYTEEANVTCNALGYRSVGSVSTVELSPDNTGFVFSGSIQCNGTELSLETCAIVEEERDCPDSTVIYIECLGGPIDIVPIGYNSNEGIFTMYNWYKLWTVGQQFSPTTAKTLCFLLGHGYEGSSQRFAQLPDNVSLPEYTTLAGLSCHGNETDIAQCQRDIFYPCGRCPIGPPSGFALLYCNECPPGYFGSHCTECECNNRSIVPCDIHTGECTCMDGWSGRSCEMDIGECETSIVSCPNNSDCTNTPGSYVCVCRSGYTLIDGDCSVLEVEDTGLSSNLLVIILSSVIGSLTVISVIAIFCLCKYRMKGEKNKPNADATITYRPGNDSTLSPTNTSDDYTAIDDRFVRTGQELSNAESRNDPYDSIDGTTHGVMKTVQRLEIPSGSDMNMNNTDRPQMVNTHGYDYTYPRVLPTDKKGYLIIGDACPRDVPTDADGYLKADTVSKIQTKGRHKAPENDTNNDYGPLQNRNQSEHEYEHMKH